MDKKLLEELINTITPEVTWVIVQIILFSFMFLLVKGITTTLVNYLRLRMSLWGLNTKLLIGTKIGYIKEVTIREVIVQVSDQETIYIPIDKFLKMEKTVYHNGYTGEKK